MIRYSWPVRILICSLPAGFAGDAVGDDPITPPSYGTLRFDEDYSYLADPGKRNDWLDPVKYIGLRGNEPEYYLSLGGELRERFEGATNPDFGIVANQDSYWLQRATLYGDLHLGRRLRIFAEGISGIIVGESEPAAPPQDDPIDLQFAFVDVVPYLNGDELLTVRSGRFGMSFGSGRLVATRGVPNIPFKFDGVEFIYSRPAWQATAFLTRPVNEDPDDFDSPDQSTAFWGIYVTHWFDAQQVSGLDLYYLGIQREDGSYANGSEAEHRHSFGSRIFGKKGQWDWNAEGVIQTGSFGDQNILAWTVSLDTGFTWDCTWQPRLGLKVDIASGDNDPNDGQRGTFDALYFKSGYFNDASLLRPANLIDVHPNVTIRPTPEITVTGGADIFWRFSRKDALYAPPGSVQIAAMDHESSYVGVALDLNLQWQISRHVSLLASYVHFFTGSYVHAGGGNDVDYFSATLGYVF